MEPGERDAARRTELADAVAALAPSELQRVLIGVHRRAGAGVEPATVLRRYREDRFAGPAGSEAGAVLATALGLLPDGFHAVTPAPTAASSTGRRVCSATGGSVWS